MQTNDLLAPLMQRSKVVVTGIVIAHAQNDEERWLGLFEQLAGCL
jgi:hypothetical protein